MKKNIKKISILLAVLAFAMLFKCSEATPVGGVEDKVMVDYYTTDSGEEAILVSPNKNFSANLPEGNTDSYKPNRLYLKDLDSFLTENSIEIKSIVGKDVSSNESPELFTGDVLVDQAGKERKLILCGDTDGNNICSTDYKTIVHVYLRDEQSGKISEVQKVAANLYDADDYLNVFDINRMVKKYLYYDGSNSNNTNIIGDTLLYSWSNNSGGDNPNPGEYGISLDTEGDTNETVVGGTLKVIATITPSSADQSVTFESGDTNIATVDDNGIVTGVSAGRTTITARSKTIQNPETGKYISSTINIVVKEEIIHVTNLDIEIDNKQLQVGETAQITATVTPSNATYQTVVFASENENIATVDQTGKITAVAPGTATITATIPEETGMTPIKREVIVSDIKITNIDLNPYTTVLVEGETHQLTVAITPENATNKTINWTSSDESIATVDSTGLVTTHSAGVVTITGRTTDGSEEKVEANITVISENE